MDTVIYSYMDIFYGVSLFIYRNTAYMDTAYMDTDNMDTAHMETVYMDTGYSWSTAHHCILYGEGCL